MKKIASHALALLMALILALGVFAPALAATDEVAPLPEIGETVSGFTVKSITPMDTIGAMSVLFEHDKTGAQLMFLQTKDTNRAFDIAFQTPALDDKGKPHVFEHITISGSQKYPDPNMFFPFTNQTYSTFINALTSSTKTEFPLASLSEDQLLQMMDYYLSGVFTPLLYTEPRLAEREAWRYALTGKDDPLTITGTVYSEMQGASTINRKALLNLRNTLFEGSLVSHESGGIPEDIKMLSYEELIEFHDAYYHPSNALIILYGDLDYKRFLTFIDEEYLCKYDQRDVYVEKGRIEPMTSTLTKICEYPVEAGATTKDASIISYAFAANGADMKDTIGLSMTANLLNQESSAFTALVRERMPGKTVTVSIDYDAPAPYLFFQSTGCNEEDLATLVEIADEAIARIAREGFDPAAVESNNAMMKLSLLLMPKNQALGVNAAILFSGEWAAFGTMDYFNEYEEVLAGADAAYLGDLLTRYLLNNPHRAAVATVPVAGLSEEKAQALAAELAEKKAAMSAEEIDALVAKTQAFIDWAGATPDDAEIKKLQAVTKESLPEEIVEYPVDVKTQDGVTLLTSTTDVGGVCNPGFLLDAAGLPIDQLQDVSLYLSLLGNLDTASHTKEELSTLMTRYAPGFGASLWASETKSLSPIYKANFSWLSLNEDLPTGTALVKEIVQETSLEDTDAIKNIIARKISAYQMMFQSTPYQLQLQRSKAAFSDAEAFNNYLGGVEMYAYLKEMQALCESDPEALVGRLTNARALVLNKSGAAAMLAGDRDAVNGFGEICDAFFEGMADTARDTVDYGALRLPVQREALVVNSDVQFNYVYMGMPQGAYTGKLGALSALIGDIYMLPKLRNALGAYGAYFDANREGMYLWTYRDPGLKGTFDIYEALPEFLETVSLTQEDVDRYIISAYSSLAMPNGPLTEATNALNDWLLGYGPEDTLTEMRQMKDLTVEDVRTFAQVLRQLLDDGVRSTSGSASTIEQNADLFDNVIRLDS